MKIFQVLSNLKHDDTLYKAGDFIAEELAGWGNLVEIGVLRIIHGAESIEEAISIVAKEVEDKINGEASAEEVEQGENTWGPKPDEEIKPEEDTKPADEESKPIDPDTKAPIEEAPGAVGQGDVPPAKPEGDAGDNL